MSNPIDSPTREKPPCKDCTDRHEACWGKCEKYKKWKDGLEKVNEERRKYNQRAAIFSKIT